MVEWTSAAGVFTSFQELGQKTIDNTSLTISPLTPSTKYVFQVTMVTPEGQGAEGRTVVTTKKEVGGMISLLSTVQTPLFLMFCSSDKLAYFQTRILGVGDCEKWHVSVRLMLFLVVLQLIQYVIKLCIKHYIFFRTMIWNRSSLQSGNILGQS